MSKNLRSLVLAYRNIQHSFSQDRWRYNMMIYHNMINCGPRMASVVGSATEIKGRGGLGAEVAERNWGSRYGASRRWMLAAWQSRLEGQGSVGNNSPSSSHLLPQNTPQWETILTQRVLQTPLNKIVLRHPTQIQPSRALRTTRSQNHQSLS